MNVEAPFIFARLANIVGIQWLTRAAPWPGRMNVERLYIFLR
jgi:hypothetical protein